MGVGGGSFPSAVDAQIVGEPIERCRTRDGGRGNVGNDRRLRHRGDARGGCDHADCIGRREGAAGRGDAWCAETYSLTKYMAGREQLRKQTRAMKLNYTIFECR
jgi:hypothetical protein